MKWSTEDILTLAQHYKLTCLLVAAADLGVFDVLGEATCTAVELSGRLGLDARATKMMLDGLVAVQLLEKQNDRYSPADGVAQALSTGASGNVLAMVRHQGNCQRRWTALAEVVQQGRPAERRPSIRGEEADQAAFIEAMDNVAAPLAAEIVQAIGPPAFAHLLDIGGASGSWTIAFLHAMPEATATLFDLPHVIPMAEARIAHAGLDGRVAFVPGDFEVDTLPHGADLAWISAIVHQNSREQNRRLFSSVSNALVDGGTVLIRDVLMDETRTTPVAGALFAVHMLVATEAGGTFTFDELRGDLGAAGFTDAVILRRDEGMNSVIRAAKRA